MFCSMMDAVKRGIRPFWLFIYSLLIFNLTCTYTVRKKKRRRKTNEIITTIRYDMIEHTYSEKREGEKENTENDCPRPEGLREEKVEHR